MKFDTDETLARDVAKMSYTKKDERKNIGSYEYLPSYSNDNTAVYRRGKRIKIGMRGSTTKGDWARNALLGFGMEGMDKDFKNDKRLYDKLSTDFKDSKISTTGHSRGGARSRSLAFSKGLEGDSFNEASSPYSFTQAYRNNYCKTADCKPYTSHRTKNDLVSGANTDQYGTTKTYKSKTGTDPISSHGMVNFY